MKKQAFLIKDITEYGKLVAYCVEHDISVWRTYWDEREKEDRCYNIDWDLKRCWYSSRKYYENNRFEIIEPKFRLTKFGIYEMEN